MDLQSGWDWRQQDVYHFRECTLDVSERLLMRSGRRVPLAPKAFDILVVLVRRSKCLVTKRELLDEVWRGVFVEPGILTVHVSSIRKALDDSRGSPTYIETVSRSGYRFIADVSVVGVSNTPGNALIGGVRACRLIVTRRRAPSSTWMNTSLDVGVHADEAEATPLDTTSCANQVRCEEA